MQTELLVYPATPDLTIKVGDVVRSFDFPGNTDCYAVGTVLAIEAEQYRIACTAHVWEGVRGEPHAPVVCPPVNGLRGIWGATRGVQRIEE